MGGDCIEWLNAQEIVPAGLVTVSVVFPFIHLVSQVRMVLTFRMFQQESPRNIRCRCADVTGHETILYLNISYDNPLY